MITLCCWQHSAEYFTGGLPESCDTEISNLHAHVADLETKVKRIIVCNHSHIEYGHFTVQKLIDLFT